MQVRFKLACLSCREHAHALHAIGFGSGFDAVKLGILLRRGCNDKLAAFAIGHAAFVAERIQLTATSDAELGHQAVFGIVDPGMDHFGIA